MSDDLVAILRDIAAGRRNSVGDLWSLSFCADAADALERAERERDEVRASLDAARSSVKAWQNDWDAMKSRAEAAEAKAARLEAALREIRECTSEHGGAAKALRIIHNALAGEEKTNDW